MAFSGKTYFANISQFVSTIAQTRKNGKSFDFFFFAK